jgi:hypothetical protein
MGDVRRQHPSEVPLAEDQHVDAPMSRDGADALLPTGLSNVGEEQRVEASGEVAHQAADDLLAAAALAGPAPGAPVWTA